MVHQAQVCKSGRPEGYGKELGEKARDWITLHEVRSLSEVPVYLPSRIKNERGDEVITVKPFQRELSHDKARERMLKLATNL